MWHVEVHRALSPVQLQSVVQLIDQATEHGGFRPVSDQVWLDLHHEPQSESGSASVLGYSAHSKLRAYAALSRSDGTWSVEMVVDEHRNGHHLELATTMLANALDVIRLDGGGPVQWLTFRDDADAPHIAEVCGLTPGRRLLQMWCELPLPTAQQPAQPLATRAFRVGDDEAAWLEVNNAAFHWHPEQGGWDDATLLQRESASWFDPQGFLLHEREGRLAGFCWTKVHSDPSPPMGEIYVIAVHPDFHGLGLGRALTVAGLQHLSAKGLDIGMLHVDADNIAAVSLYDRLGFTTHHVDQVFVGDIERTTP